MSGNAAKLYTADVLGLAVLLAQWPYDPAMARHGRARSPSCGSAVDLSLNHDDAGLISAIGIRAHACAVGQGAAAIFAGAATGKSRDEIGASLSSIEHWLSGTAPRPLWPGLEVFDAVPDYPARHAALLLPWRAALDALPESSAAG